MMKSLYEILGVQSDADAVTLKRRYRELARELHPDKTGGDPKKERRFKEVAAAYAILSDPSRRSAYDRERGSGKVPGGRIFGMDFDSIVDRLKTEGIRDDNASELLDDFFSLSQKFYEEIPKKVNERAVEDPGSLMGLIEDLFGVIPGTSQTVAAKFKVTVGPQPKPGAKK